MISRALDHPEKFVLVKSFNGTGHRRSSAILHP